MNAELVRELARVIADPGSVLPRDFGGPARAVESMSTWTARAVLVTLPRLAALSAPTLADGGQRAEHAGSDACMDTCRRLDAKADTAP